MSKGPVFCPKSAPEISGANAPEYSGAPENLGAPWNSKVPRIEIHSNILVTFKNDK